MTCPPREVPAMREDSVLRSFAPCAEEGGDAKIYYIDSPTLGYPEALAVAAPAEAPRCAKFLLPRFGTGARAHKNYGCELEVHCCCIILSTK